MFVKQNKVRMRGEVAKLKVSAKRLHYKHCKSTEMVQSREEGERAKNVVEKRDEITFGKVLLHFLV